MESLHNIKFDNTVKNFIFEIAYYLRMNTNLKSDDKYNTPYGYKYISDIFFDESDSSIHIVTTNSEETEKKKKKMRIYILIKIFV